jgi:hypothetical protein
MPTACRGTEKRKGGDKKARQWRANVASLHKVLDTQGSGRTRTSSQLVIGADHNFSTGLPGQEERACGTGMTPETRARQPGLSPGFRRWERQLGAPTSEV